MEVSSSQEAGEIPIPIPIPINSSTNYGGGHAAGNGHDHHMNMHHIHDPAPHHNHNHNNIISPTSAAVPSNGSSMQLQAAAGLQQEDDGAYNKKVAIRYRECLKNHAAGMGGNATDGFGEFMPSGEEGTIEALNCSACNCHRNFHRKEVEGEPPDYQHFNRLGLGGRKFILGGHHHHHHKNILTTPEALGYHHHPTTAGNNNILPSRTILPPHHMIMPYNIGSLLPSESDEQEDVAAGGMVGRPAGQNQIVKKRFRTKFTQEQKEKMLNFADKVGWKIQKQEESAVQQFCQEIGVKRRVLKVWMHNNKHNLAKKNNLPTTPSQPS